jgi:hypothetical protein
MGQAMNGARAAEQVRQHRFDALLMHCPIFEKPGREGRVDEARERFEQTLPGHERALTRLQQVLLELQ